jgi:peptidoglycan L-alanyl-D-glutamate endopeptidase CwlK
MDSISEQRLKQVHPVLAAKVRAIADKLATESIYLRVVQGYRTLAEQDTLYKQGRSLPGPIVTNAPAGRSYHNYGLAVDVVPSRSGLDDPFDPDWNHANPAWGRMIAEAQAAGLECGADWSKLKDYPHVQLTGKWPAAAPPVEAYNVLQRKGLEAVWDACGIGAVA